VRMRAIGLGCRLRDPEEIVAEYEAVVAYHETAHAEEFQRFLEGARAALTWVLGHTSHAPASRRDEPVTVEAMQREERFCDSVIYSSDPRPVLDPDFANGVEHALSWARGAEELPPTPLDLTVSVPSRACACG
jgi:hypothetical protein